MDTGKNKKQQLEVSVPGAENQTQHRSDFAPACKLHVAKQNSCDTESYQFISYDMCIQLRLMPLVLQLALNMNMVIHHYT